MPRSACATRPSGLLGRFRVTLLVTCALFVLCAPATVVYGQTDVAGMTRSMTAMAEMSAEDRRESMRAAAMRGGTCGMDMTGNHSLDSPAKCTDENYVLWNVHRSKCTCSPRETFVSLYDANTPNMLVPSVVAVNRCSGYCHQMGHSCMATHTAVKTVTLVHYDKIYYRMMCGAVRVEEDTKCGCSCPLTADDCNEQQVFRPGLCLCQCKSKNITPCDNGRRWDGGRCRCVCETQRECSTGYGWSNEHCRCLMMMMPPVDEDIPSLASDNSVRF